MINQNLEICEFSKKYLENSNEDFKYVIIDDLFDHNFIKKCSEEFAKIDESLFVKYSDKFFEFEKYTLNDKEKMGDSTKLLFNHLHSPEFIKSVSLITGMKDLMVDDRRWGGGLHMTKKDGYLSVHKDFNILPTSYKDEQQMLRCINIIGYLNEDWEEEDGGDLEFWDKNGEKSLVKVGPRFNRWVIFDTRNSFHGHPYPYKGNSPRISIAAYYYIKTNVAEEEWESTMYLKLPWMDESEEYKNRRKDRANAKIRYKDLK